MPARTETISVEISLPRTRLDTFLRAQFPAMSRVAIQRLIEQGHIQVNGRNTKPTHHPRAGKRIEVRWPEARPAEVQPEAIPLDVLFEDADPVERHRGSTGGEPVEIRGIVLVAPERRSLAG